jgi:hypothetical protein
MAKHNNLVNINLLVKYYRPEEAEKEIKEENFEKEEEPETQTKSNNETPKRNSKKRIVENRPDDWLVPRS